jgi:hypothetical protein
MDKASRIARLSRPHTWAEDRLGLRLHPKQSAVLRDLFPLVSERKTSRVCLRKANEVGGTRTIIAAAVLFSIEILDAEVISTAGKWLQVQTQLIPALKRFQHLFPSWDFLDTGIKVNGLDRYIGFSTNSGFAQGFHRTENRPLVAIIDEAGLVDSGIFDDMEDRCNPQYFLAAGAPMDPAGKFYDYSTKLKSFYNHHHISQMDCLAEDGYWLERVDVERKIAKYGREHPFIQSNVYGEFAAKVEGGMLSLAEFNACASNPPEWHPGINDRHLFIDVGVNNCAALRHGNKTKIHKMWTVSGVNEIDQIVGQIIRMAVSLKQEIGLIPGEITIDGSGNYGKLVGDALQASGWSINRFFGQTKETDDPEYANRISEAYLAGIAKIKACDHIIPDNDNFRAQCLSRLQRVGTSGKLQVEPKDEYCKRGFESPHEADAIFGAMTKVRSTQSFNLAYREPDERGWLERARDEQHQHFTLPAESCL